MCSVDQMNNYMGVSSSLFLRASLFWTYIINCCKVFNQLSAYQEFESGMVDLVAIQNKIIAFRNERDWAQFHDPKNLAEALSIEAGELLENFLWKTTEQSRNLTTEELKNVKEELADIFIFLTYISEEYKIDLLKEVEKKIALNEAKYPVEKAKGSSRKYTEL